MKVDTAGGDKRLTHINITLALKNYDASPGVLAEMKAARTWEAVTAVFEKCKENVYDFRVVPNQVRQKKGEGEPVSPYSPTRRTGGTRGESPPRTPAEKKYPGATVGSVYYDDLNIKYLGQLKDGKKHGNGKYFHQNGELWFEGVFQNDGPHGEVTLFHDNKQQQYVGGMTDGKRNGTGVEYFANGQKKFEGAWANDEPYGENIQVFNEDGSVAFEGTKAAPVTMEVEVVGGGETVVTEEVVTTTEVVTEEGAPAEVVTEEVVTTTEVVTEEVAPAEVVTEEVTEVVTETVTETVAE